MTSTTTPFPGSFPVISETGLLFGYVFPTPPGIPAGPEGLRSPAERGTSGYPVCDSRTHWTYATAPAGYVSPFNVPSRAEAVLGLLAQCDIRDPASVAILDLDLAGVLHGLAQRYTRRQMARAAITYATCRTRAELVDEPGDVAGRWADPDPMDRGLIRETIHALIGPSTADDVLAAYDKVAPTRFGHESPFVHTAPAVAAPA